MSLFDPTRHYRDKMEGEYNLRMSKVEKRLERITAAEDTNRVSGFERMVFRTVARQNALTKILLGEPNEGIVHEPKPLFFCQFEELYIELLENEYESHIPGFFRVYEVKEELDVDPSDDQPVGQE